MWWTFNHSNAMFDPRFPKIIVERQTLQALPRVAGHIFRTRKEFFGDPLQRSSIIFREKFARRLTNQVTPIGHFKIHFSLCRMCPRIRCKALDAGLEVARSFVLCQICGVDWLTRTLTGSSSSKYFVPINVKPSNQKNRIGKSHNWMKNSREMVSLLACSVHYAWFIPRQQQQQKNVHSIGR